eukprot:762539-Hanusia_phi.AAC.9
MANSEHATSDVLGHLWIVLLPVSVVDILKQWYRFNDRLDKSELHGRITVYRRMTCVRNFDNDLDDLHFNGLIICFMQGLVSDARTPGGSDSHYQHYNRYRINNLHSLHIHSQLLAREALPANKAVVSDRNPTPVARAHSVFGEEHKTNPIFTRVNTIDHLIFGCTVQKDRKCGVLTTRSDTGLKKNRFAAHLLFSATFTSITCGFELHGACAQGD